MRRIATAGSTSVQAWVGARLATNLLADAHAIVHMNGQDIAIRARRVVDRNELHTSHDALEQKYGGTRPRSPDLRDRLPRRGKNYTSRCV
jgi:hypothetical protein